MLELKAHPNDNINVVQMMEFVIDRVKNIAGKGENAGYKVLVTSIFFFSRHVFSSPEHNVIDHCPASVHLCVHPYVCLAVLTSPTLWG